MIATTLSLVLCLAGAPALALSTEVAAAAGSRLAGQQVERTVEDQLAIYLDDDDIAGAQAFVADLADRGEIGESERRALEDRIWSTKTERTLEYARKIREAIRDSDLDAMREYNARMQRLTGSGRGPVQAEPAEELAEEAAIETETPVAAEVEEDAAIDDEVRAVEDDAGPPEADESAEVIADLVRRGEVAIEEYHLTVAPPGTDSALGMVDQLMALGDEGRAAAEGLGRRVTTIYKALIERDIARGLLDKARTFAERMGEVAERAGLSQDDVDALKSQIDEASAGRQEHERLMQEATQLLDRGKLVAPNGEHALALAAEAFRLGFDPEAVEALLDDIVVRQRSRADDMVNDGRFRDGAEALNSLGDGLLAANIGETTLVADLRTKASALYRRADLQDRQRERAAALAETAPEPEGTVETDENGNPFTFINPF